MLVRELITKLGFKTDAAALAEYESKVVSFRTVALAAATAIAAVGVAGVESFHKLIEEAEGLKRLKSITGDSVEDLQRLDFVAKQSNTSLDELSTAMRFFALKTGLKPSVALFERLATQLQRIPPERRLQALAQFFGPRGAPAVVNLLKDGPEGMRRLVEQFNRFGTTLSGKDVDAVDQLGNRLNALQFMIRGIRNQMLLSILPTLESVFTFIETRPKAALARFGGVLIGSLLLFGRWRLGLASLLLIALEDIRSWQKGQESIMKDIFGPWEDFVDKVGPAVKMMHDLMFGKDGEGGWATWQGDRAGQLLRGDFKGYARDTGAQLIRSPILESIYGAGASAWAGMRSFGGAQMSPFRSAPMINAPITITVPAGTPQQQVQQIGDGVHKALKRATDELNSSFPQVER